MSVCKQRPWRRLQSCRVLFALISNNNKKNAHVRDELKQIGVERADENVKKEKKREEEQNEMPEL